MISNRTPLCRTIRLRRTIGVLAALAAATALSACASTSSFMDRGGMETASSDAGWAGAAKPHPVVRTTVSQIGSQPLLPPVPEEGNGLAPIKISALSE